MPPSYGPPAGIYRRPAKLDEHGDEIRDELANRKGKRKGKGSGSA